jgi:hypothetical protein
MLRFKVLAFVVPLMAVAVLARGGIGSTSHPCIAFGETSVELASVPWAAALHVAFTDDPARATVRVQVTDDADAADFVLIDDAPSSETGACESSAATRFVAISARPTGDEPLIYLSRNGGPADYRIYVRSKTFSDADAAALIVGAGGGHRRLQAASL